MNAIIPVFAFAMATFGSNAADPSGAPATVLEEGGGYVRVQSESPDVFTDYAFLQLAEGGANVRTPSVPANVSADSRPPLDEGGAR